MKQVLAKISLGMIAEVALLGNSIFLSLSRSNANANIKRTGIMTTVFLYCVACVMLFLVRYYFLDRFSAFITIHLF